MRHWSIFLKNIPSSIGGLTLVLSSQINTAFADQTGVQNFTYGVQCHFKDGSKLILTRAPRSDVYTILLRSRGGQSDVSTLRISPSVREELETNGGVMKQLAIDRAFHSLKQKRFAPVKRSEFEKFLKTNDVPSCPWPSLYYRLSAH